MSDEYANKEQPTDQDLNRIAKLASYYVRAYNSMQAAERELETMKKDFERISTVELPNAMAAVGLKDFRLNNGYRIKVEDVFNVRLTKQNINRADEWLDKHGHGGMIKRQLVVDLPKTIDPSKIEQLKETIKDHSVKYEEVKNVHWTTIQSWATEMKNEGEEIPEDIFNVFVGNRTVITE